MANLNDPIAKPDAREEAKIERSRNDPTPHRRTGDARFLPVVIVSGIALILILIAAVVIINQRGKKMVPQDNTPHPTSSLSIPASPAV
jgi:hypothetical protein